MKEQTSKDYKSNKQETQGTKLGLPNSQTAGIVTILFVPHTLWSTANAWAALVIRSNSVDLLLMTVYCFYFPEFL